MDIKTKFNVGDKVYLLIENNIRHGVIRGVKAQVTNKDSETEVVVSYKVKLNSNSADRDILELYLFKSIEDLVKYSMEEYEDHLKRIAKSEAEEELVETL